MDRSGTLFLLFALLFLGSSANDNCIERTLDFVMLEDNSNHAAIEDDIRAQLKPLGITVNARKLDKEAFNVAMTAGDFHLCFSETWGAPYDPVSYVTSWMANNEAHYSAMSGVTGTNSRANIFAKVELALSATTESKRAEYWGEIHQMVHQTAVNLPLWGKRIPAVLNQRLAGYFPGFQQFDYPVHRIMVQTGSKTVTIAPGSQTGGLFQSVGGLDPHSYRPNEFFASNWVYEGLVSYGSDGAILPALAESWTETSQSVTFKLRQGVKFHDGEDWDCSVAKLNFEHVFAEPLTSGDYHGWYKLPSIFSSVTCNSDDDLVLQTTEPYSGILQELTFIRPLRMLSPASFMSTDADSWMTNNSCPARWGVVAGASVNITCGGIKAPVGTGPFKYISQTTVVDQTTDESTDTEVVFHAHEQYWGGAPDIQVLKIKHFATADAVKQALLNNNLDMVAGDGVLKPADLTEFMTTHSTDFYTYMSPIIMNSVVIINSGKAPTDDIQLRKAIIHGVDKTAIIKKELDGIGDSADRLFPVSAPYSQVELTPRWDYDYEKAELLNCPVAAETSEATMHMIWPLGLAVGLYLAF